MAAAILGTMGILVGLLMITDFAERRFVSSQALIRGVARSRRLSPDSVEALVAREAERVLGPRRARA
ncbi:MAG TPA: hypothetical protein VE990_18300 [Acidimicrobiales bacterium]|nr:hypothetical protein [Acidimicrobiales bacterium]